MRSDPVDPAPSSSPFHQSRLGKPHYATLHGKLGLAAVVLSIATPLLGAVSFKTLGLLTRFPQHTHARVKRAHRSLGAAALTAAALAAFVGVGHPAVASPWLTPAWRACIAVLGIAGVAAAHAPTATAIERALARALESVGVAVGTGKGV